MKKCAPSPFDRLLSLFAIAACALAAFWAFFQLFVGGPLMACLIMGLLFGASALYLLRSAIMMSGWGYFYDEEKIIFVLSRKERREFRWEQLKGLGAAYPAQVGYFYFQDGKKIALNPRMKGYEQLIAMFQKQGLSAASAANFAQVDPKDIFHQMFGEEFGKSGKTGKKK